MTEPKHKFFMNLTEFNQQGCWLRFNPPVELISSAILTDSTLDLVVLKWEETPWMTYSVQRLFPYILPTRMLMVCNAVVILSVNGATVSAEPLGEVSRVMLPCGELWVVR